MARGVKLKQNKINGLSLFPASHGVPCTHHTQHPYMSGDHFRNSIERELMLLVAIATGWNPPLGLSLSLSISLFRTRLHRANERSRNDFSMRKYQQRAQCATAIAPHPREKSRLTASELVHSYLRLTVTTTRPVEEARGTDVILKSMPTSLSHNELVVWWQKEKIRAKKNNNNNIPCTARQCGLWTRRRQIIGAHGIACVTLPDRLVG